MTLGRTPNQGSLLRSSADYCRDLLSEKSIYALLERDSHRLFPDDDFADLFQDVGRRSIPPRIVAVVMVLQRAEGLSDRERQVLIMRFGLADGRMRTLEEVGSHFNVTRERIRQLETKALAKLRHPDKSGKLEGYLESS